ncbi:MAG: peptidoglycan DD-metalloendopeptidase family protein [Anaerolineae bacterium]
MHLALLALLVVAGWHFVPPRASKLSLGGMEAPLASSSAAFVPPPETSYSSRYLQPNAVPYTVRVMGDVLPLVAAPKEVRTWVITYSVQAGDTVSGIAERFGLQSTSILWANDRIAEHPDYLQVGQDVLVPPVDGALHVVAKGDTIESIAKSYTVDPEAITSFPDNHLEDGQPLTVGERLVIPGGQKPYQARRVYASSGNPPVDASRGSGSFAWPMSGYITQQYWSQHQAIDIGAAKGTPIYASDSGYVSYVQFSDSGYGNMAMIDHRNGYVTLYAHMSIVIVDTGQSISKGQLVGYCGSTGNSTGPHLHFEVIENGVKRNPLVYLP